MAEITGAQLVIDSLRREGVDTIYVLPGDPVGDIVNGWADAGHKAIAVRHEQAACMAAQAHSYLTRSVGVCIAASGAAAAPLPPCTHGPRRMWRSESALPDRQSSPPRHDW